MCGSPIGILCMQYTYRVYCNDTQRNYCSHCRCCVPTAHNGRCIFLISEKLTASALNVTILVSNKMLAMLCVCMYCFKFCSQLINVYTIRGFCYTAGSGQQQNLSDQTDSPTPSKRNKGLLNVSPTTYLIVNI